MIGTPEERFDRRRAARVEAAKRAQIQRVFGSVNPGTLARFEMERGHLHMSSDRFLLAMLRFWRRNQGRHRSQAANESPTEMLARGAALEPKP